MLENAINVYALISSLFQLQIITECCVIRLKNFKEESIMVLQMHFRFLDRSYIAVRNATLLKSHGEVHAGVLYMQELLIGLLIMKLLKTTTSMAADI